MASPKRTPKAEPSSGGVNTVRLPRPLLVRLEAIAEKNYLSVNDVIKLCLADVLPRIEKDGLQLQAP